MHGREEKAKTEKKRRESKAVLEWRFEKLIRELLLEEGIPAKERLNGLFLAMRGHGLRYDAQRAAQIQKLWLQCVADPPHRRRKT